MADPAGAAASTACRFATPSSAIAAARRFAVAEVLLGGHHDQTVSARAYVHQHECGWGIAYRIINVLFFWQENHCRQSYLADVEFAKEVLDA